MLHFKIILLAFWCTFFLYGANATIKENSSVSALYDKYLSMPSKDILEIALKYDSLQDKNKAIVLYTLILGRYKEDMSNKDKKICAKAANAVGILYAGLYNYSKALKMYLWSDKICMKIQDSAYKTIVNNNIGIIYTAFQDNKRAIPYFKQFFDWQIAHKQYECAGDALNNLIYCAIGTQEAYILKKYLLYAKESPYKNNFIVTSAYYVGMSTLFNWNGQLDSALLYAQKALDGKMQKNSVDQHLCSVYQQIANTFYNLKNYDSALVYLQKSNNYASKNNYLDVLCENYRKKAKIYEQIHSPTEYIKCIHQYLILSDSLYSIKEYGTLKDLIYGAQVEQTEEEVYKLQKRQKENQKIIHLQKGILMGSTLISIGVLSLLLFLYLQKKKLKRSYQNLFLKNQELIESEKRGRYSSSSLNNTQKDSLIENICKLMENSVLFLDPNFSLEILSEELQSNSKYVSQVINEHFHKNFTTFVNEYRVKEACKLFADDAYKNLTIEAIAEKVGFKNRTSFNPVFKKYTGITPSQYMNMCLNS